MAAAPTSIISHWNHLLEGFQTSPMEFYKAVERGIEKRQIPEVHLSRVQWHEGGPLSAKREYLRVTRREHIVDVCGAPFGTGFFVSWWLGEVEGCCLGCLIPIPFLGGLAQRLVRPQTYYRIDTALMFQGATSEAVREAVEEVTSGATIRPLSELDWKPIMREFYRR